MYPFGLKNLVTSLVQSWKIAIAESHGSDHSDEVKDRDLLAACPKWCVRSLRRVLGLVIASYDYTVFYEEMLLSAHKECGTRRHPYWCSGDWEIDFMSLIEKGIDSLNDRDVLVLALHPAGVMIAHEIIGEEIMYGDRIAEEWHELVGDVYKERKRQVLDAADELARVLESSRENVRAKKCPIKKAKCVGLDRLRQKKQLLEMISGDEVKVTVEFSAARAGDESDKIEERQCIQCKRVFIPKGESWEHCEDCSAESIHLDEIINREVNENIDIWEDAGASLSDLSLEKLDALDELELA